MRRAVALVCLALLLGCASNTDPRLRAAQEIVAAEELVVAELSHGGFESLLNVATEEAMGVMRPTFQAELGHELTATEDEKLARAFRSALKQVYPRELWVEALQTVYTENLSLEEMEAILRFYRAPEGTRLLEVRPRIQEQATLAAERMFSTRQKEFEERLQIELPGLFAQEEGAASSRAASDALSVSGSIQACRAIQSADEIPIGCDFNYVEGKPALFVVLPNMKTVNEYWKPMSENVAGPFCSAANASSREALVFVSLHEDQLMRMYECESDLWGDWVPLKKGDKF